MHDFKEVIEDFTLYDREYFEFVFSGSAKVPLTQLVLRTITGRSKLTVRDVNIEHNVPNLLGRGIRMDARAIGGRGSIFDVEFQRCNTGASPHRARFNASLIDANLEIKGMETNKIRLPETFVIFITLRDVLKGGLPIYHIGRTIAETGAPFGDGSHIIYVNGSHKDRSTKLGMLIHDLRSRRASDMLLPELAERTRELKETEEGRRKMSALLEKLWAKEKEAIYDEAKSEGIKEGLEKGKIAGLLEGLFMLVQKGELSIEAAADAARLSVAAFMEKMAEHGQALA